MNGKIKLADLTPESIEKLKEVIKTQIIFANTEFAPTDDTTLFTVWCRICEANKEFECTYKEFQEFVYNNFDFSIQNLSK